VCVVVGCKEHVYDLLTEFVICCQELSVINFTAAIGTVQIVSVEMISHIALLSCNVLITSSKKLYILFVM